MRKLKNLMLLIMTVSLVTMTGCKSDDDGGSGGNAAEGTLTAKIAGSSFTSEELATTATIIDTGAGRSLTISGGDFTGKTIVIGLPAFDGEGTYEVDSEGLVLNSLSLIEVDVNNPQNPEFWQAPYAGSNVAGTISISSETETHVVGTFTMKVKGGDDDSVINITSGSFNIELQ
jgi:hypothetical protein